LQKSNKAELEEKEYQISKQKDKLHKEKAESKKLAERLQHSDEIIAAHVDQVKKMKSKELLNFRCCQISCKSSRHSPFDCL
jgi:hypothetical protein